MNITERLASPSKCRVHLHVHMDGCVRPSTIWEVSRLKNLELPGKRSLSCLKNELEIRTPTNLNGFLSKFRWIAPPFIDDLNAIHRMAVEFLEDQASQGVLYCELRFSPPLLVGGRSKNGQIPATSRQVLSTVVDAVKAAEKDGIVKARIILCCIRGMPQHYRDILALCQEFRDHVVGIDVAGDELNGDIVDGVVQDSQLVDVFQEARKLGIHRTAHAGEEGPAAMVKQALDELMVERIGHGYHVLDDANLMERCVKEGVHFECCPSSSYLTGAVQLSQTKHPVQTFREKNMNFSISVDDSTITSTTLGDEVCLLTKMGFNEADIAKTNFDAARACFLPENEKKELIRALMLTHGMTEDP